MSVSSGLSGRYAKAIYELAVEKKIISKVVDDFVILKKLLEESDSLYNLINSPAISKSNRQNSILKILNKKIAFFLFSKRIRKTKNESIINKFK